MKSKDLNTLENFLKQYSSKTLLEYPTPVGQQGMGTSAKANKSPTTAQKPSPSKQQKPSPTIAGAQPEDPTPYVMRKASELEVDTEYKDPKGKVLGKVVSKVGDGPNPEGVVVQDPVTKKLTVMNPDETVSVDNPELQEDSKPDPFERLSKRKNKLKRKIKHLLRAQKYQKQGDPIFEINFNSKQVAQSALDAPIMCGFEAETTWPDVQGGFEDDDGDWMEGYTWSDVSDLIYDQEGSRAVDRLEQNYREWLMETDYFFDAESDVIRELVVDRREDEAYIDDYVDNRINDSEVEDYKENYLDGMSDEEREEYEDWDYSAWARQYVEEEMQDDFEEWLADEIRDNSEHWDDAWERAMEACDIDRYMEEEHGTWYDLLRSEDIYLYNENGGGGRDEIASRIEDWASNNSQSNDVRSGDYHSGSGVDNKYWRVEDDSSIEGEGTGAEIISPVYDSPRKMLQEMKSLFDFMEKEGIHTNDSTGLHITMSWSGASDVKANKLKIAVLLGDKYVAKQFGRESNSYSRSQLQNIQQYMADIKNDINNQKSLKGLEDIISGGISNGKFSSVNFKSAENEMGNELIEFRVAGGEDYHNMMDTIIKTVIRYGAVMQAGHNENEFKTDYVKALFRLIRGQDEISTDVQQQAQQRVDPESINDKVLDAFQKIASKKHYTDSIEALSNAYMSLADVKKMRAEDPQGELDLGEDEEQAEPSWRVEMKKAQQYFVRAFAMLASDVASGANRAQPKVAQISALRNAVKEFGLTGGQLWDGVQQSEFVKRFPGEHHIKLEKMAAAMNSLLKKQDAKAPEASFSITVPRGHVLLMPEPKFNTLFKDIFGNNEPDPNATVNKDDFKVINDDEIDKVKRARYEMEYNERYIENEQEMIKGMEDQLKTADPEKAKDLKDAIRKRQERVAEWQAENSEYRIDVETFVKKHGFAPASVRSGSEPIGTPYRHVHDDHRKELSQRFNIRFDVQESVFAKFDKLPLEEKLELLNKIDTVKLNEAWSKKYKDSINCSNPKGFSQKAHCAGKKKNEAVLGPNPTSTSLPGYIKAINDILSSSDPVLKMGPSGEHIFTANPGQSVNSTSDVITGTGKDHMGKDAEQVIAKTLWKGQLKSTPDTPSAKKINFNRGEVAEAYHALAAFVRFVARPTRDITLDDVVSWIPKLENGVTYDLKVTDAENKELADEFWVTVSLKPEQWAAFKQPEAVLADKPFAKIVADIITDANKETGRRADKYATNGRYDLVRVIGDGVSGETETKTDIEFENETESKYRGYSIKVGSVKQIHQVGGGAISGARKASAEERYNILQDELFGVHGRFRIADISDAKVAYMKAAQDESVEGRLRAQAIGYKAAVESINNFIKTDDDEKKYVQLLAKAFKFFQARDDDRILLKQFTGTKKGTYILDPKRFDKLHQQGLNLVAVYDEAKENPEMAIIDQDSNKRLVTFRTYKTADGYMRNYIEKGDLWKELTNIANVKESVREGAVPDNSKVKLLRELLSKPLMSGDLKAQMNAYVAIPDPSMIKDFRAARAMAGDEHDLRDVLRSYAKVKLHPDVLRKIK